jgi:hypothetical protein
MSDQNQDYCPPQHVMDEWRKACSCCPMCSASPCDGVAAGGPCDDTDCDCNHGYDDPEQDEFEDDEAVQAYVERNWFRVEVIDREGAIVSIEPCMLAGRDIGEKEQRAIIAAVRHLSGFIGSSKLWDEI